jgi:SAM-dependent methyltransferase
MSVTEPTGASTAAPPVDEAKLEQFLHSVVADLGAVMSAALVNIGDKLGLYRALADAGPTTPAQLAERTGTAERYIREWCAAQAAGGYLSYDPATATYHLPPEQAMALADDTSPVFMLGGFDVASAVLADEDKIAEAFRTGEGVGWHEHDARLYPGTERFFRPNYRGNLVDAWIPALEGVRQRLVEGIHVADVGCGHGASTVLLAQAFPASTFSGFDYHPSSIQAAREAADRAGVADRVRFDVASAKDYASPEDGFGLIMYFDCLHDMGDPVGALRHARSRLAPGGTVMLVEPRAGDRVEENLNPVGRLFYGASTTLCTPASLDQEVGLALGAQAGPARLEQVVREAGFTHFREATSTPFNLVLEARV